MCGVPYSFRHTRVVLLDRVDPPSPKGLTGASRTRGLLPTSPSRLLGGLVIAAAAAACTPSGVKTCYFDDDCSPNGSCVQGVCAATDAGGGAGGGVAASCDAGETRPCD